ncbi:MAG: hypothetical protein JRL30_20500 [Deltaproteobacteria bacterium]|nr:hypothetical protein [Deltaproteobacteria bacterium]
MPAKVKIVRARDFLQTTPEGDIDLAASLQMLTEVASARHPPANYDVLLDLRRAQWRLSTTDVFEFAKELSAQGDLRTSKIAFLFLPGADFDDAAFLETCSKNRGMNVDIFSNFEDAIQWFFSTEDTVHESSDIKPDEDKGA